MNSLSQQIERLINPEPLTLDPEDHVFGLGSGSANVPNLVTHNDQEMNRCDVSVLRRKPTQLLSDYNQRYLGEKVERKRINESDEEMDDMESEEDFDESLEFYSDNKRAPIAVSDEYVDSTQSSDSAECGDDMSDEYINQFSSIDVADEMSKAVAVKNQLIVWDNLLESRIKLQKVLIACNRLPQLGLLSDILTDDESLVCLKETETQVKTLVRRLVDLDQTLELTNNMSDECETHLTKSNDADYGDYLSQRHNTLTPIRNNIIDKWYERTRFSKTHFNQKWLSGLEQSSTKQIENILSDMERLVRRTQTKRSVYTIIGKNVDSDNFDVKQSDPEVYDDDDFYHQLLRELIETKSGSDTTDAIAMSRKWSEIEKLRNRMRRKVDTKASKGRKVRYETHSKLVGFMAPILRATFAHESRDELFMSLFG